MQNNLALLGFFIVSLLLYRRLFKVRLPKEILPTDDLLILIMTLFICLGMFFLVCINIYKLIHTFYLIKNNELTKESYFIKLKKSYQNLKNPLFLISESLIAFDIFIKNKINVVYLDNAIMFITHYFNKHKKRVFYSFISLIIIIQFIVSFSFFIDVFFLQKFYYFYKTLWLLIFPLIINYLLYSIKAFIDTNFNSLEQILILKMIKTSDYLQNKDTFIDVTVSQWRDLVQNVPANTIIVTTSLSPAYLKTRPFLDKENTLNYCVNSMNEFLHIDSFLNQYDIFKNNIFLPFNIFKYFLYFIGWGYVLFLII